MNEIIIADLGIGNNPQPQNLILPTSEALIYGATGVELRDLWLVEFEGRVQVVRFRLAWGGPVTLPVVAVNSAAWRYCWGALARHLASYYPWREGLGFADIRLVSTADYGRRSRRLLAELSRQTRRPSFPLSEWERAYVRQQLQNSVAAPASAWGREQGVSYVL
jgi:hypothetical protein